MTRRAVNGGVMTDHEFAVTRRVNIEFDRGRAHGARVFDRGERRRRAFEGASLVREGDDPTRQPLAHFAGSPWG
jgi:hypothetical protein